MQEVQASAQQNPQGAPDLDSIRLRYIQNLARISRRAVIVYASGWLLKPQLAEAAFAVEADDVHALMECCNDVEGRELDLILHSPGGTPEAAEQILNYLRTQFDNIRCFVPLQAKSAATMIALGCDEIVLGLHSELGPIDPQILVPVPEGQRFAPAHAILRDFERAKREIGNNVAVLPTWTPILRGYSGGLIEFCNQQIRLAQDIVAGWLETYMLSHPDVEVEDKAARVREISGYFGSEAAYDRYRTHGRPIRIEELEEIEGLRVLRLEEDDRLQDAVLSIYHALDITFGGPAIKIVENHRGRRKVRLAQQIVVGAQLPQPPPPEQAPQASEPPT